MLSFEKQFSGVAVEKGAWLFCPFSGLPLPWFSLPGSFTPWLIRLLARSPSGLFSQAQGANQPGGDLARGEKAIILEKLPG